jgi:GMP synthase (glutamine-hydrolysing)
MKKVLVFGHVAHKILGTLNPALKGRKLRLRYVNFERNPDEKPTIEKYHGLIILGGHMGVYEKDIYTHIKVEMQLIEEALKKDIPILGICLGAQILAHVLGAPVTKSVEKEIGWYDVTLTDQGQKDPIFSHFKKTEKIFQLHGDTFALPKDCTHIASSKICEGQAFRYKDKVYGLQFHLEVDGPMIERWLNNPLNLKEIEDSGGKFSLDKIRNETKEHLAHSNFLSQQTFKNFIDIFDVPEKNILFSADKKKLI